MCFMCGGMLFHFDDLEDMDVAYFVQKEGVGVMRSYSWL